MAHFTSFHLISITMDSYPEDAKGRNRVRGYSEEEEELFQERALFWEEDGVHRDDEAETSMTSTCRRILSGIAAAFTFVGLVVFLYSFLYGDFGSEEISVRQSNNADDSEYPIPDNNDCIHAALLTVNTSSALDTNDPANFVFGTVLGSDRSSQGKFAQCVDVMPMVPDNVDGMNGVWYRFEGTGEQIRASTCERTEMDTLISVFVPQNDIKASDAEYCSHLECVAMNDDACGLQSSVRWQTFEGEVYFIYVQGSSGFDLDKGNFAMTISADERTEPNDRCEDAQEVEPNSGVVFGSNFAATAVGVEFMLPCGVEGFDSFSEGVWYSVVSPTTQVLEVSTCRGSDFDTIIHVFSGKCGELDCLYGDENSCGWNSRLEFEAKAGEKYFIYVHGGWTGSRGKFGLEITAV